MNRHWAMWRNLLFFSLGLGALGWVVAHGHGQKDWPVPEEAKKLQNPVPLSEPALAAAKGLYGEYCAQCHGDEGKGDGPEAAMYRTKPANFTDAHMMAEMTDGEIFYKITQGRKPMPSFRKTLTDEQRWQLVHFVKTFAAKADPPAASPAKKPVHKH